MELIEKISLGGGCHWCTEAVFQSLEGVVKVEQGFVASNGANDTFSEAVVIYYDAVKISLQSLISIHLHTHKSMSDHSMRGKYRSAVYVYEEEGIEKVEQILIRLQNDFPKSLVTRVYPFRAFKPSDEMFHRYYYSNMEKPFCKRYITPKIEILKEKFSEHMNKEMFLQTTA